MPLSGSKQWYESKGIWGPIVVVLSLIAGVFGYAVSAEEQEIVAVSLAAIGSAAGALLGAIGRIKANKEIKRKS